MVDRAFVERALEIARKTPSDGFEAICVDYLRLTDTAPITEQGLRERGFKVYINGLEDFLHLGHVFVQWHDNSVSGRTFEFRAHYHWLNDDCGPRNAGELEQLLRRVNGGDS